MVAEERGPGWRPERGGRGARLSVQVSDSQTPPEGVLAALAFVEVAGLSEEGVIASAGVSSAGGVATPSVADCSGGTAGGVEAAPDASAASGDGGVTATGD